jgi:hypothetical protein
MAPATLPMASEDGLLSDLDVETAQGAVVSHYWRAGNGQGGKDSKPDEPPTTWKRSQVTANAARLMVGDQESLPLRGMQAAATPWLMACANPWNEPLAQTLARSESTPTAKPMTSTNPSKLAPLLLAKTSSSKMASTLLLVLAAKNYLPMN